VKGRTSETQNARITNPERDSDLGNERLYDVRAPGHASGREPGKRFFAKEQASSKICSHYEVSTYGFPFLEHEKQIQLTVMAIVAECCSDPDADVALTVTV
jgi:hypothetical protein